MDKVLEILNSLKPNIDFENAENLVDAGILTSFDILRLVNELNNEFDIEITPLYIIPENFKSARDIWNLVEKLQNED